MSIQFTPELLSAYLDGELSESEKIFVEETLHQQPGLQEQLAELRSLSDRVQRLPRADAPDGLRGDVLAAISRRDQIEQAATPSPVERHTNRSIPSNRRFALSWVSSVVALVVVAVGLVALNQNLRSPELAETVATNSYADRSAILEDSAVFDDGTNQEALSFRQPLPPSASPDQSVSTAPRFLNSESRNNRLDRSVVPSESLTALTEVHEGQQALPEVKLLTDELQKQLASYEQRPEPGDEFALATMSRGTPVIVDFTVVDIQETVNQVRVLLKEHTTVTLDDQVKLQEESSSTGELTIVAFDVTEPELEVVLSNVEALEAVMYLQPETEVNESEVDGVHPLSNLAAIPPLSVAEQASDEPDRDAKTRIEETASDLNITTEKPGHVEHKFHFLLGEDVAAVAQLPKGSSRRLVTPNATPQIQVARTEKLQPGSIHENSPASDPSERTPAKDIAVGGSKIPQGSHKQSSQSSPSQTPGSQTEAALREAAIVAGDSKSEKDNLRQVERKIRAVLLLRQFEE